MSDIRAGWYPDPEVPTQSRYWDGTQWTEHRAPMAPAAPEPGPPLIPPPPAVAPSPTSTSGSKKGWLIGGAIATGVIVVGSVGAAIGAGGNREPDQQASASPVAIATQEPDEAEPTPAPTSTLTTAPAPAAEAVDSIAFRAQAGSHLDDMNKDLGDMAITVQEEGFWRLLSNSVELSFNLGQLEALDVPESVAATWPGALTSLDAALDVLSDAVSTQDGPTILAAIEGVRAQVEASRGVADSAG
ncbi:DUF2510 domain-containing protein [Microbacterium sp. NPDC089696]|uniref:DUF2510 domain-containing protein n=1 Tax=Microbacterium sp. NPDC089696 TaxID=3364199 RepID=UPI00381ACA59